MYRFTLTVQRAATLYGSYVPCDEHIGKQIEVHIDEHRIDLWPLERELVVVEYYCAEGECEQGQICSSTDFTLVDIEGWLSDEQPTSEPEDAAAR
jgi:hypothetical protein